MALSTRDRRALMVLVPFLALAVIAFVLLTRNGKSSGTPGITGAAGNPPVTAPSPTPSPSPSPSEILVFSGRDPFQSPFGDASSTTGSSTPTPSVSPAGSPPPTPTGGSSTTSGSHTVVLVDIFSDGTKAQVEVDGTVYTVGAGDTFAGTFKLVSISGSCAKLQNGSQTFTLCETANK